MVKFISLKLHNFMCFENVQLDLNDNGYVLINGINENTLDNAISNGSGKSTLWDALSWVLTGETIRHGSKDIRNIYNKETDGCWVEVLFNVDNDNYKIIRSKESKQYKNQLLISINDKDVSGKGIRDSEKILAQFLPQLNSQLLGSVIIFGQGLPNKFTNNTPSGRKELLEKLSESDYMIQDLKSKVSSRLFKLKQDLRNDEDNLLAFDTEFNTLHNLIDDYQIKISELNAENIEEINAEINELKDKYKQCNNDINEIKASISLCNTNINVNQDKIKEAMQEELKQSNEINNKYSSILSELVTRINATEVKIQTVKQYIATVNNIKDVCPTCGQKISGVEKPSLEKEKAELVQLQQEQQDIKNRKSYYENEKLNELKLSNDKYDDIIKSLESTVKKDIADFNALTSKLYNLEQDLTNYTNRINTLTTNRDTKVEKLDFYNNQISQNELKISQMNEKILYYNNECKDLNERISIVSSFDKALSREFRGYLLNGIIDYLNERIKHYSLILFKHTNIEFSLNGNDLIITFQNKLYEDLSGGEKQKIDIIVQLSLRDMMVNLSDFSCNILVLDEITDNLDSIGCDSILSLISNELQDLESIYIISHKAGSLNIPYDHEINIVKHSGGISELSMI